MNKLIKKEKAVSKPFPKLMKAVDGQEYVFFECESEGQVVYVVRRSSLYSVGDIVQNVNINYFEDTNDQVILNDNS